MKLTEYIIPVISLSLCIPKAKLTSDVDKQSQVSVETQDEKQFFSSPEYINTNSYKCCTLHSLTFCHVKMKTVEVDRVQ